MISVNFIMLTIKVFNKKFRRKIFNIVFALAVSVWRAGGNCSPQNLKDLSKIRILRAATKKYLGKTKIFPAVIEKIRENQTF